MKLLMWRTILTSEHRKNEGSKGSVTLEAALAVPVFLMVAVLFLFFLRSALVAMALYGALSTPVRESASVWYPVSLGLDNIRSNKLYAGMTQASEKTVDVGEALAQYGSLLPSPIGQWAKGAAEGQWTLEGVEARVAYRQWVTTAVGQGPLDNSKLKVSQVELPDKDDLKKSFIKLSGEYELGFRIPRTGKETVVRATAMERAWIGGLPSSARLADQGDAGQKVSITFVSMEPNPARLAKKVTLTLKTSPNQSVDLSVFYKSGPSEAKHLGKATSNAEGLVTWTWFVSGRTTPGEWQWEASGTTVATLRESFEVEGKSTREDNPS